MKVSMIVAGLVAVVAAAPAKVPTSAAGPDPTKVQIRGITYAGSGCPAGSVANFISDDASTFTLAFDNYVASTGPTVAITESRKNCQLNVDLRYPQGWQYSVFQATYRGYMNLDPGVQAIQKATYYFSGMSSQSSAQSIFNGPRSSDFTVTDTVDQVSQVWSPCGAQGALNINSQVRLTSSNRNAQGLITTDSLDGKFTQIMGVSWRTC